MQRGRVVVSGNLRSRSASQYQYEDFGKFLKGDIFCHFLIFGAGHFTRAMIMWSFLYGPPFWTPNLDPQYEPSI
jgi:hypothetical protein